MVNRIRPRRIFTLDKETVRMIDELKNYEPRMSRIVDQAVHDMYKNWKRRKI